MLGRRASFVGKSAAFGSVLWLCAGIFVRLTRPVFFEASSSITNIAILYGVSVPITYIYVEALKPLLGVSEVNKLAAVTIATITATFLDGVAMVCAPDFIYGGHEGLGKAGAWILWAVGWGLYWAIDLDIDYK